MDSEPREDPDLVGVWADMDPTERLRLLLAAGEEPPAEVSEAVRRMYGEPSSEA